MPETLVPNVPSAPQLDIDLYSPQIFQDPFPFLESIRSAGRVVRHTGLNAWMLTSDRLIRKVLSDPQRFTLDGAPPQRLFGKEAFIVIDDRPRHDALRNVWAHAFQRDSVAAMRPLIEKTVDELLTPFVERLRAGETVDAYRAFCRDLPAYIIAAMLGVPDEARPDIVRWSDLMGAAVISPPSADGQPSLEWVLGEQAKKELAEFLIVQMNDRRQRPTSDLISQMVNSEVARGMSDEAIMTNCRQLLFAGNETTAKWLAHSLVVLDRFRDARADLIRDTSLVPQALEEVMRFEPVVHRGHRIVRGRGIEIEGVPLADGDLVILFMGAANRDPDRHPRPNEFDIHREPVSNLGFGFGMHSCLGIGLARLEAQVAITRILERIPGYRVAGPVGYNGLGLRGPTPVPVAI